MPHLLVEKWSLLIFFDSSILTLHFFPSLVSQELINAVFQPLLRYMQPVYDEISSWLCFTWRFYFLVDSMNGYWFSCSRMIEVIHSYSFKKCYSRPKPYSRRRFLFLINGRSKHTSLVSEIQANWILTLFISSISRKTFRWVLITSFLL